MNITGAGARASTAAAVRAALIAVSLGVAATLAHAQAADQAADTPATASVAASTVEVGIGDVGTGSYKAGEYNGLEKKGAFFAGAFDLRDRAAYTSASALRWHVRGTDLGLETRNISADLRVQGRFRLKFVYDELRRNRSDSYQTPFDGAGTNVLTLPGSWLVPTVAGSTATNSAVNTTSARGLIPSIGTAPYIDTRTASPTFGGVRSPNAAQIGQVTTAAGADLGLFHNVNLFTKRTTYDVNMTYALNDRWAATFDFQPQHRVGLKPMGTVSRSAGGDISSIIPDRIDTNTDQVSAGVNFKSANSFAQAGYYGSIFRNHVPSMSFQNWAIGPVGAGATSVMSSTPSNEFSQLNGSIGYNLSKTTKVVASGSYSRATQNDAFLTDAATPVVPVSSLNGLVVSTFFTGRFSARPAKKLNLGAAYRYSDRHNRTAVNLYQYADASEAASPNALFPAGPNNPLGAVVAQNANANRPYSRKDNAATFDADYALRKGQWLKAGYDFEKIDRFCDGTWISCANGPTTNENTMRGEWRASNDVVRTKVEYAYSARRVPDYNENAFLALVPYANVSPTTATGGATALSFMLANGWNGWGPTLGFGTTTGNMNVFFPSNNALANAAYANNNRISELPGLRRFFVADRNRNKLRTSLDWQATEALSIEGGVDFNKDRYPTSVYGLQRGKDWAVNLDGNYTLDTKTSADVYYTYENQQALTAGNTYTANSNASTITGGQPGIVGLSGNAACDGYTTLQQRNNNNKLDPCLNWSSDMLTKAHTAGISVTRKAGSAELTGNVTLTRVRWDNAVNGGNWANNILNGAGGAPTTVAAWFIPATPTPTVTTNTLEFRVNGRFEVTPRQALRLAYAYLRMTSADFAYEGMQFGNGTISGVLPTNEQPFNYNVHLATASYVVSF